MKNLLKGIMLLFFVAFTVNITMAQIADGTAGKTSIVKITTEEKVVGGKKAVYNATGWCWKDKMYVVTSLHAVAGMSNIKVSIPPNKEKETVADIYKVYKEADLALLKLRKDIGLKPLKEADADANSMTTFQIWGYPHNIYMIQGKPLNFNFGTESRPTLNSILAGSNTATVLKKQKYPSLNVEIFKVGTTIQPGHSGAPILNKDNQVIGVAEGGLKEGVAGINFAIRSKSYLQKLYDSNESTSMPKSTQAELFSSKTIVPDEATEEEIEQYMAQANEVATISSDSGKEVHRTWQASLEDIAMTMDDEDIQSVQTLIDNGYVFINDTFEVYEDYSTGATFAIPTGFNVVYQDGLFMVQGDELIFAFVPINTNSFPEAQETLNQFITEMHGQYPTKSSMADFPDTNEVDEMKKHIEKYNYRQVEYQGGQYMVSVGGKVEGTNVAAMYLDTKLPAVMTDNQLREFFLFALASELASFSKN